MTTVPSEGFSVLHVPRFEFFADAFAYLSAHGFPAVNLAGLSAPQIKDLAGEAFSLPCATLIGTCIILSLRDDTLWERPLNLQADDDSLSYPTTPVSPHSTQE